MVHRHGSIRHWNWIDLGSLHNKIHSSDSQEISLLKSHARRPITHYRPIIMQELSGGASIPPLPLALPRTTWPPAKPTISCLSSIQRRHIIATATSETQHRRCRTLAPGGNGRHRLTMPKCPTLYMPRRLPQCPTLPGRPATTRKAAVTATTAATVTAAVTAAVTPAAGMRTTRGTAPRR